MRKAERLFQILTYLRSKRTVVTAIQLAELLEVSERTIYRDIQALSLSGIPIESETGVGYRLQPHFTIPPIMFDEPEIEALLLGAKMVESWGNKQMASAVTSALAKIHAVLPEKLHRQSVQQPEWLIVPKFDEDDSKTYNQQVSAAIKVQQVINLNYTDEKGNETERVIWPLGLIYWGKTWTLLAWCTKRQDYRLFRLDRIQRLTHTDQQFKTQDNLSLQHYLALQKEQYGVSI
ncbi:helix-turn-helix transcriptional regulator [Algibacillus agarilyticus]|uniref:helix-turn-helix transcriptional regulator n=1 Tax=Algibacillus agarilyticus TaxID=2234133 RepID=UPI000DD056B0|nr:YafY family protein [Algibacillus agarilyticus]